jgi:nucleoside-diphosphate-sugar epimerase
MGVYHEGSSRSVKCPERGVWLKDSYWKNKTVIVSGGLGFIGSHFVEELASEGAKVICLYRTTRDESLPSYKNSENIRYIQLDLEDRRELEAVCKYAAPKIDCFIHCAALDGNTEFKLTYAAKIMDTNNRLVSNVLNSCRTTNIKDVVLLSSTEIYSAKATGKISEVDDYHRHMDFTDNGYNLSKIFGEISAELHHKQYGMRVYASRPTNVYGPRDSFNEATNRVIPSMIRKVANDETIEIWGNGKQTRSFIYVKDLVKATLRMVEKKVPGAMNIATKDQVSVLDLANYISEEFGAKNKVHLDESKPIGVKARDLDVTKMYNVIDFEPIAIREGLKRTIDWYRAATS